MRIGIDARFLGAGASSLGRYSENLLMALSRQDTETEYLVFVHASLERKLKVGDNFRLIPVRGYPLSMRGMMRMALRLYKEKLDLFHVHFPLVPLFVHCPMMVTVHDTLPFQARNLDFARRMRPMRWLQTRLLYPWSLRRAKWIVCVSWSTRDQLCEYFPDLFHKSTVIHSGLSDAFRTPPERATLDLIRSRLELPDHYILYSGSARSDKNIESMVRAFALLRQRRPDLHSLHFLLEIAGDYDLIPLIERMIRQFGLSRHMRVLRNMGNEERRVLFEQARLLMLLSRHEGFGFPVLEAQVCGLPVIAAESGALPEIAGEGAVLADPDNLEHLVLMIENVLSDQQLRDYLVKKGRANVQRFDWNKSADHFLQMYRLLF